MNRDGLGVTRAIWRQFRSASLSYWRMQVKHGVRFGLLRHKKLNCVKYLLWQTYACCLYWGGHPAAAPEAIWVPGCCHRQGTISPHITEYYKLMFETTLYQLQRLFLSRDLGTWSWMLRIYSKLITASSYCIKPRKFSAYTIQALYKEIAVVW